MILSFKDGSSRYCCLMWWVFSMSIVNHKDLINNALIHFIKDIHFILSKCFYQECSVVHSTHSVIFNSMILMSISLIRALQNFDFVIAFARLLSSSIHLISAISLLSYDCRKHIKSIINRFSLVASSLT
jgi:hypothetical protein